MKILNLRNTGLSIAIEMSSAAGITYAKLLHYLKTPAAVLEYINMLSELIENLGDAFNARGKRFVDNWPWLRQEAEEGEYWDGQPVVCDGWFELKDDELWYSGNEFTHGAGKPVSRKVKHYDIIDWHCCEFLKYYVRGIKDVR